MTFSRERPPFVADERTQRVGWLDQQRALVRWKCEGLAEADELRSVLPESPAMTMAGLVSHLRWVEHCWFEVVFLNGSSAENPQFDESLPEDADMLPTAPLKQLLDEFEAQCERSNEIIAAHSLDETGKHPGFKAGQATLRWMVLHMIEETARHVGHLDTIRELLDGRKGYY